MAGGVFRHCEEAHADAVCAIAAEAIDGTGATAAAGSGDGLGCVSGSGNGAAGSGDGLGRGSGSGNGSGAVKSVFGAPDLPEEPCRSRPVCPVERQSGHVTDAAHVGMAVLGQRGH